MIELGLQRILKLLPKYASTWRAVHVAGTNGKGTVCSFVSEMLNAYNRSNYRKRHGYDEVRHGRFTSPHLVDRWDCITRNNADSTSMVPIGSEEFYTIEHGHRSNDHQLGIKASEFEILTATAFEAFERHVDIGVVEVGLGGRLDCTNVFGQYTAPSDKSELWTLFPPPLITTITSIGLDHQELLGNTYAEIAQEKAGIMKRGVPVTWNPCRKDVYSVLEQHALQIGAPIIRVNDLPRKLRPRAKPHGARRNNGQLAITCTVTALTRLDRMEASCARGESEYQSEFEELLLTWRDIVRDYVFPGRQEWLSLEAITGCQDQVLLDGAHNAQGIEALRDTVSRLRESLKGPRSTVCWVVAISDSKDRRIADMLKPLLAQGDTLYAVEFEPVDGMPWVKPRSRKEIALTARGLVTDITVYYPEDLAEALTSASEEAAERGANVVVCGSLYLAGDVHRMLRDRQGASVASGQDATSRSAKYFRKTRECVG